MKNPLETLPVSMEFVPPTHRPGPVTGPMLPFRNRNRQAQPVPVIS